MQKSRQIIKVSRNLGISIHDEEMSQEFLQNNQNESSDEEEEEFQRNSSPRKRRFRKTELEEFHGPLNQQGFLQVETFFLQDFG